jgi:hypothetical protein
MILIPRSKANSNSGRFGFSDLRFAVPVGAEDAIVWPGGSFAEVGVHKFPDQFAITGNLKEPAEVSLADQRVAVG